MESLKQNWDVIVIGGGPAGTISSYFLVQMGYSVLLLEKHVFPRFHIGESTVPYISKIFEKMGLLEEIKGKGFVQKYGIDIGFEDGRYVRPNFTNLAQGQLRIAFNLDRASFDDFLLEKAKSEGVVIATESKVLDILFDNNRAVGVMVESVEGQKLYNARYIIDASGKSGVISKKLKLRKMNSKLKNIALFKHYTGLKPENDLTDNSGDLMLNSTYDGWAWGIPTGSDFSMGVVLPIETFQQEKKDGKSAEDVFEKYLSKCPRIKKRIEGATPTYEELKVESNYCYHSEIFCGSGFFLVGDAACFVDPAYSGGIYLSAISALKVSQVIDNISRGQSETEQQTYYENFCKTGYDSYYRIIYALYLQCKSDLAGIFMNFETGFDYVQQVLCGDFWASKDHPLMSQLWAKEEWNTFETPFTRVHECPLYNSNERYTLTQCPENPLFL